ncbi:unnamed protein product [Protopolystoma xenopodis]|uniref:Uncharacterized protein n=1 Tax=Protopolystoma xenopodis TaxID=117903 RepID=A0A448W9Q3_9PLAT|nr:unnamed protein product [Protopolystoma xenopodis]
MNFARRASHAIEGKDKKVSTKKANGKTGGDGGHGESGEEEREALTAARANDEDAETLDDGLPRLGELTRIQVHITESTEFKVSTREKGLLLTPSMRIQRTSLSSST